jgi:hypothetical protein
MVAAAKGAPAVAKVERKPNPRQPRKSDTQMEQDAPDFAYARNPGCQRAPAPETGDFQLAIIW